MPRFVVGLLRNGEESQTISNLVICQSTHYFLIGGSFENKDYVLF